MRETEIISGPGGLLSIARAPQGALLGAPEGAPLGASEGAPLGAPQGAPTLGASSGTSLGAPEGASSLGAPRECCGCSGGPPCSASCCACSDACIACKEKEGSGVGVDKEEKEGGDSDLAKKTREFLSIDYSGVSAALNRFRYDPRLAVALRLPSSSSVSSPLYSPAALQQQQQQQQQHAAAAEQQQLQQLLPPPPPPLNLKRLSCSVDTILAAHEQQALQVRLLKGPPQEPS